MKQIIRPDGMASGLALILVAASSFATLAAAPALFNSERMFLMDGKPRLILGLYEHPAEDARLRQAVEAGFNLIYCPADAKALDRVRDAGANAWINLGGDLDLSVETEKRRAALLAMVNRFKSHPALLIWEGPDEAPWNNYWAASDFMHTQEFPAMNAAIEQRGGEATELRGMVAQMRELLARGLADRFEAVRSNFWQRMGKPCPNPAIRIGDSLIHARRMADGITAGLEAVRQADPHHALWLNHAPCNSLATLRLYNRAADMAGCDIYPIPANFGTGHSDIGNIWPSCVGDYTDRTRKAAPGKACAMVLQGFGWRDLEPATQRGKDPRIGRRPGYAESRFMAYNALMHGANALLYWGTAYAKSDADPASARGETTGETRVESQLWRDLLQLVRELRALEPALLAPPVRRQPQAAIEEWFGSNDGTGLRLSLRRVGDDYVLLAANETGNGNGIMGGGLAFTVQNLPAALEGRILYRLGSDESHVVKGRAFRDGVQRSDVHVYATSRRFEPPAR